MLRLICLTVFLVLIAQGYGKRIYDNSSFLYDTFPDDFIWSTATSSYQIEGAWDEGGKGLSIWDTFCRLPGKIRDGSNGDVACDSYHKYKEDIQLIKNMGVKSYRFSIAWPRILPNGTGTEPNMEGVNYYKTLITEMKAAGIEPLVTLYHWDLPQVLEDVGGWTNESVVDAFEQFTRICYQQFGPQVNYWITFNEPWVVAHLGYESGSKAPGRQGKGQESYIVGHNMLKAHARAYHMYQDEFKATQGGEVGITLNVGWSEPIDPDNQADVEAAERALQFDMGWFGHPVFVDGDYPAVMKERIHSNSMAQGFNQSRLPTFTEAEKAMLKNSSDFFGLNYYGAGLTGDNPATDISNPSFESDKGVRGEVDPDWIGSGSSWLHVTPWSMRRILNWIKARYDNPRIFVTENGVSDKTGTVSDASRVYYYKEYINSMLKAIKWDGCRVIGYTAWSLMDNFEWEAGYDEKFGIHYVNFSDPNRPRVQKDSAKYIAQIVADNGFVEDVTTTVPPTTPGNSANFVENSMITYFTPVFVLLIQMYRAVRD